MASRRELLLVIGALAPMHAFAQHSVRRISMLLPGSPQTFGHLVNAFRSALRELGYQEGHEIVIEQHYLNGDFSRLPAVAEEIVRKGADVIVVSSTPVAMAMKQATQTLPIVIANGGGLVEAGLVASLARPGGNVTGMSSLTEGLIQKQLALLLEFVPTVRHIGTVRRIKDPVANAFQREAEQAARKLGVKILPLMVSGADDLERLQRMIHEVRPDGLIVLPDPVLLAVRESVVAVVTASKLPAIYPFREYTVSGGMISYGVNIGANYRQAATYVDRIMKGAKPSDLPIQQPTRFELVVNRRAVRHAGLAISPSLMIRIDEMID
jgi:putative ABC transport system substrate-binding protein